MKKFIALLLAALMVCGLAACVHGVTPDATPEPTEEPIATAGPTAAPTEVPATEVPATAAPVEHPACPLEEYPKVDGSTANIPMAIALAQVVTGCTEDEAAETIDFSTTDYAYDALAEGRADLLLVYEASKPTKEKHRPETKFDMRPIGLDALVFITNRNNPVESLTEAQIRGIFSGEITNWNEVGGLDQPIKAFQRPELSGSQTLMLDLVMKEVPMADPESIVVSNTMSDVIRDIAAYDDSANAIGYSVYYYAQNMYNLPNLKFITVDGVEPSYQSINAGDYPYINPFYAILPKTNVKPIAKNIADWLETEEGQYFVADCGYVPYMRGLDLTGK